MAKYSNCRFSSNALALLVFSAILLTLGSLADAQTATTGALRGTVRDVSGAVVANASVTVVNEATGEQRNVRTGQSGSYLVPLLAPGTYRVEIALQGFEREVRTHIVVAVTQTTALDDVVKVGNVMTTVEVSEKPRMVETEEGSLGDVIANDQVQSLPLVTRNYTQIMDLSAGVATSVTHAEDLGRGSGGQAPSAEAQGMSVQGARAVDNNFQLNGVNINDFGGSGIGIAIPNPDTIQEFRVQTGMYDAQYGRNAGANVDLITKGGANTFHGGVFEFWRNDVLNANDYFFKLNGEPLPELKQNQFGGTFGGPAIKNKLLFFGSYQGTRQVNAVQGRQTFVSPPLTDDRSAAGIGAVFAGQQGYFQTLFGGVGPSIAANGSNVNPVALALLQMKLPNGNYLFPSPKTSSGLISLTQPATFNEDQYMSNFDYLRSTNDTIQGRFFLAKSNQSNPFGGGGNLPGSPLATDQTYLVASLSDSMAFSANLINQAHLGYARTVANNTPHSAFTFSDVGITSAAQDNTYPAIAVLGSDSTNSGQFSPFTQNNYDLGDNLVWNLGRHNLRLGGSLTRSLQINKGQTYYGSVNFATWPDFILGLDGADNGTGMFSNVLYSVDLLGILTAPTQAWEAAAYLQDDYKLSSALTVNLGLRYEWMPPFTAARGRASNIDPTLVNPNPPAAGSYAGFVVPANYSATYPTGVAKSGVDSFAPGTGTQTFGPRVGFAWSMNPREVLRGGYGIYYSSITGNSQFQSVTSMPWVDLRIDEPPYNGSASFADPFIEPIPSLSSFPSFQPYTPSSDISFIGTQMSVRPGITQEYTLNLQTQLKPSLMLQLAYLGSGANHLMYSHSINQAQPASTGNPIRGETTNTLANLTNRVPYLGFDVANFIEQVSEGRSNYNALEVTMKQNLAKGLQFLAAYTWSKTMATGAGTIVTGTAGGGAYGDQNNLYADYGPADFSRPQRVTVSASYNLPAIATSSRILNAAEHGWELVGVATLQSGLPLDFTNDNSTNLWGISQDHAYIDNTISGCSSVALGGAVKNRLGEYFNTNCFTNPPTISSDGGTAFGNTRPGMLRGPAQDNLDFSFVRHIGFDADKVNIEFRAEFFNALNHAQFANPDTAYSDGSAFGQITATSVAARIGQLALKLHF
jgi:hypothetical protein